MSEHQPGTQPSVVLETAVRLVFHTVLVFGVYLLFAGHNQPGGGFVGIHGTDAPQILPGRVSHGCVRMRNPAILRLFRLMPLGTPVTIR